MDGDGSNDGDDELSVRGDSMAAEFYRIPLTPICRKKTKNKRVQEVVGEGVDQRGRERERKGGGEERGERGDRTATLNCT